ncbi:uncharacterized protein LOC111262076 isoform X1 [Varroa jacobsoni]|uniref:uncharacterized protein LOC111262076 isoform X1 n=1 Tax=Varroa jacobsoni TaxID=62625 RepID=UPI000BF2CB73|nr:uncharacterized protein LOC111262076 isoform X1 [Varroa jacobsoni]XP_022691791.1 uncharacterized protein LOC111262076 isoform X1 [Varroa jacobsoni]
MASAGLATLVLSSSSEGAYNSSSTILQRKVESQPDSNADANYNDNIYRSSKRRDATTCNSRNRSVTLYCSLAHVLCGILLLIAKMHYLNASAVSGKYEDIYTTGPATGPITVDYKVDCSEQQIRIRVNLDGHNFTDVYLENLKGYPGCVPNYTNNRQAAVFDVPIRGDFRCGVGKMTNKITGLKTYFHRIVLEEEQHQLNSSDEDAVTVGSKSRQTIFFKCQLADRRRLFLNRAKRAASSQFPFELVEPDHLNITEYIEAHAPVPYLEIGIRQNGRLLDTTFNVQPGTPLEMVIYLDQKSKSTYGILSTFLKVSDSAGKQEEVIIMNGCSIDPYIFSNFETPDGGDTLSASFKAFKFPESNYVMFSGTVSICINRCKGIPCGNGQLGYGRRKREIPATLPKDPNALYSVELSTMLKVRFDDDFFKLNKASLSSEFNKGAAPVSSRFIEAKTQEVFEQRIFASDASTSHLRLAAGPTTLLLYVIVVTSVTLAF